MTNAGDGTVLIADDEPEIVELYEFWLGSEYDVETATSGDEALELIDDAVGVVLLDRNMPERSGDDVLEEIRRLKLPCRVSMVTAIEPSFDVIGMPFDDYLVKPIFRKELTETVVNLLTLSGFDETIQEYFALVSKMATLKSSLPSTSLESNDEYVRLKERVRSIRKTAGREFDEVSQTEDFESTFRRLSRHWDVYAAATADGEASSKP